MKKMMLPLLAVCCLAPAAVFAGQQHPLITDTVETVAPSKFEAETALEYGYTKNGSEKIKRITLQETVTGGITPKLDGFITLPFSSLKFEDGGSTTNSGFNDITAGVKYNALKIDKTEIAVKPFIILPTGDDKKGLGSGGVGFGAVCIASFEINHQLAVDGNIRLLHQATSGDSFNEFDASAAGKYSLTKDLKVVGELGISKTDVDGSKLQSSRTGGAIFAVKENLDVDAGIRIGLTKETEDFALLAGVTFKF